MFSLAMARLTGAGGKEFSDATDNNGREGTTLDISPETGKEPLQDTREHSNPQDWRTRPMTLEKFLSLKRADILKKWFDLILETYPADTSTFLRNQKNPFTNPVGNTIYQGMEKILDELTGQASGILSEFLDNIIRVRAVQDFLPSQAVSFVFSLKKVIREEVRQSFQGSLPYGEMLSLEDKIDALALSSFDLFMKCREKLYDIKANEMRNMTFRLLQRVNDIGGGGEKRNGPTESNEDNAKEKEVSQ